MESPKKVAMETARALAKQPEVLVAACTVEIYPEHGERAIQILAAQLEVALRRCMHRDYPKEG
jgi:hypothetical protein